MLNLPSRAKISLNISATLILTHIPARVWNRTFALRVLTQRRMAPPWIAIPVNQKKAYFSLCIIKYFLDIISPNNDMKEKIDALLSSYPSIDINAMGFPRGWESEPLWL